MIVYLCFLPPAVVSAVVVISIRGSAKNLEGEMTSETFKVTSRSKK